MILKFVISLLVILLILLVVVFIGWILWVNYMDIFWICDGCVCVDVINVVVDVFGIVVDVLVCDNQLVKKGDLLMQIDFDYYCIVVKQVELLVVLCKVILEMCQLNVWWCVEMDEMVVFCESCDDVYNIVVVVMVDYEQVKVQFDVVCLNLECIWVVVQVDGYVINFNVYCGDYVWVGEVKMVVIDKNFYWVYGYFEEIKLLYICEGDLVDMQLMSGEYFKGYVESIVCGIYDCDNLESCELIVDVNFIFNWVCLVQCVLVWVYIDEVLDGVLFLVGIICMVIVKL